MTQTAYSPNIKYFTPLISVLLSMSTATFPTPAEYGTLPEHPEHPERTAFLPDHQGELLDGLLASDLQISSKSPTAADTGMEENTLEFNEPIVRSKLDDLLEIVCGFKALTDGWDDADSLAPNLDVISDALVVLQNWPRSNLVPEPTVGIDGRIALEIYDKDGFTQGGVELIGNHLAIFSALDRTKLLGSGRFNTEHQSEILQALSHINKLLT